MIHAAEMARDTKYEDLKQATEIVAHQQDGMDIVVSTPVAHDDRNGNVARARALSHAAQKLQHDFGTRLFIADHRSLEDQDEFDRRTFRDLRKAGHLDREVELHHCRPSVEPLLTYSDVLAWSYRQHHLRRTDVWFDPLKPHTDVVVL